MKPRLASFRLWLLVTMLCAGAVDFGGARVAIGRIEQSEEQASDHAKDLQIARSIAARAARGADMRQLTTIQSVLPNDQILVYRGGRLVFAGPPVTGSAFELEVTSPFPGGRVVLRDYHRPVPGSALGLTLVVGGWVLLVILSALVAAWWLTRAMQGPIDQAVAAADRVAAGDFTARIGAVSPDDFARLAKAFDSMAARLEAVDRDQRQFLADVAHEIATPVNAISGLAGALADGTLATDEQRAEAAGLIETQTGRLGSLLEDLRRLTRLDLAEPVRWQGVDVAELCHGVRARFGSAAALVGVELSVQAEHCRVTADPRLLEMILDNLVSNAIRYTPAGEACGSGPPNRPARWWSRSPTPASASPVRIWNGSSTASTALTGRETAPRVGRALVCPLPGDRRRPWTPESRCPASPVGAVTSGWSCRRVELRRVALLPGRRPRARIAPFRPARSCWRMSRGQDLGRVSGLGGLAGALRAAVGEPQATR